MIYLQKALVCVELEGDFIALAMFTTSAGRWVSAVGVSAEAVDKSSPALVCGAVRLEAQRMLLGVGGLRSDSRHHNASRRGAHDPRPAVNARPVPLADQLSPGMTASHLLQAS